MPLQFSPQHADGPVRVLGRIQQVLAANARPSLKGVVFDTNLSPSHKIYALRAGDLAGGKPLDQSVHYCGYRYIVTAGGQPHTAAEVHKHSSVPGQYVVFLNMGPFVGGTAHALNHLAAHPQVMAGSFEARFLRCAPLSFVAIWLKSSQAGGDLIYPLPGGAPEPFSPHQLYSLGDFTNNIQAMVQQRQAAP